MATIDRLAIEEGNVKAHGVAGLLGLRGLAGCQAFLPDAVEAGVELSQASGCALLLPAWELFQASSWARVASVLLS